MSTGPILSAGFGRIATHDLTHVGLVVSPRRASGRWFTGSMLSLAALAAGAGIGYAVRDRAPPIVLPLPAGPSPEVVQLRQELERASSEQRLTDARGQELERQIDGLNLRLRDATVELTFIRKAREGKQP